MVSKELLEILVCPETKQKVALADDALVEKINRAVEAGSLTYRNGEKVTVAVDGGLLREDGKVVYAIRDGIPVMLSEEAIDVSSLG